MLGVGGHQIWVRECKIESTNDLWYSLVYESVKKRFLKTENKKNSWFASKLGSSTESQGVCFSFAFAVKLQILNPTFLSFREKSVYRFDLMLAKCFFN